MLFLLIGLYCLLMAFRLVQFRRRQISLGDICATKHAPTARIWANRPCQATWLSPGPGGLGNTVAGQRRIQTGFADTIGVQKVPGLTALGDWP